MPSLSIASPIGPLTIDAKDGAVVSVRWADEIVVVTPSLDRERRIASYTALAAAWRTTA